MRLLFNINERTLSPKQLLVQVTRVLSPISKGGVDYDREYIQLRTEHLGAGLGRRFRRFLSSARWSHNHVFRGWCGPCHA